MILGKFVLFLAVTVNWVRNPSPRGGVQVYVFFVYTKIVAKKLSQKYASLISKGLYVVLIFFAIDRGDGGEHFLRSLLE